jgi:hypothetical protein
VLCPLTFKGGKRNEKLLLLLRYFAEMAAKNRFIFHGRFFCVVVVYEGETCYDWQSSLTFPKFFVAYGLWGVDWTRVEQIFQAKGKKTRH